MEPVKGVRILVKAVPHYTLCRVCGASDRTDIHV